MTLLKPHISLFDKSFSDTKTIDYKVYLELSLNGLKYTLFDSSSSTFIGLEVYRFNDLFNNHSLLDSINKVMDQTPLLRKTFKTFHVAYMNQRATLIPNAIFQANKLSLYHQYNFAPEKEDVFKHDNLINLSAKNIYSIPTYILSVFKTFKNVSFSHSSSVLIEAALLQSKKENASSLIRIHIMPNAFQVIAIKNHQLELYNSFTYQTSEDFLYYLLFVLNQLKIDNQTTAIQITGEVEKNSTIYTMLYKYIKTVDWGKRPEHLKFSYILEEIPTQFHYTLFNQHLCE